MEPVVLCQGGQGRVWQATGGGLGGRLLVHHVSTMHRCLCHPLLASPSSPPQLRLCPGQGVCAGACMRHRPGREAHRQRESGACSPAALVATLRWLLSSPRPWQALGQDSKWTWKDAQRAADKYWQDTKGEGPGAACLQQLLLLGLGGGGRLGKCGEVRGIHTPHPHTPPRTQGRPRRATTPSCRRPGTHTTPPATQVGGQLAAELQVRERGGAFLAAGGAQQQGGALQALATSPGMPGQQQVRLLHST